MTSPGPAPVPEKYEDLAGLIEYSLIQTNLSEEDIARGCESARKYCVASVIVRPSDLDAVARWLAGSNVQLGTIVDSPHGSSTTDAKNYAARDFLRRGAKRMDTVLNTGKLISRQFQYLEMELLQMAQSCRESGASLTVNLETEHLTEELKIVACRILRRAEVEYIGTPRVEDVPLLQAHSRDRLKIKLQMATASLESAIAARDAGCARLELSAPEPILEAWKQRLAAAANPQPPVPNP